MPPVVERSFETGPDVVAGAIPYCRHRLGRSQTPASRTANKKKVVVQLHAKRLQLPSQALREARVNRLVGKGLPLNKDSPFADRCEIWDPNIGPLCASAHIDKLRPRARLKRLPDRLHIDIIDRLIAGLCAQRTHPPLKTRVRRKNKFGVGYNK